MHWINFQFYPPKQFFKERQRSSVLVFSSLLTMKKHLIVVLFALLGITFLVGEVEGLVSSLPGRKLKVSSSFPFFLDRFILIFKVTRRKSICPKPLVIYCHDHSSLSISFLTVRLQKMNTSLFLTRSARCNSYIFD